MFNYGHVPHDVEVADARLCYRCTVGLITPIDVFANHCTACLVAMTAEVDGDFGAGGPAQLLLARHRAFADWLHRHGR
jgi:hypothetical protein